MAIQELIKAVREHAERNYTIDGWDYVIETLDNFELASIICPAGQSPSDITPDLAIYRAHLKVWAWDKLRQDSRETAIDIANREAARQEMIDAMIEDSECA